MKLFFKKVPSLIYAIIIISIALILTNYLSDYLIRIDWIYKTDGQAKVGIFSGVLTIIGLFFVVIQIQAQKNNDLIATEYINQPNFQFLAFNKRPLDEKTSPMCCCVSGQKCTNNCIDEHWFNLKQVGNLPVADLKISMLHSEESINVCCDKRIHKKETLIKDDIYQYKLPPYTFNKDFLSKDKNGIFNVLLSYKSLYSNIRYKRWSELEYSPSGGEIEEGVWGKSITFYSIHLRKCKDENSISVKEIFLGKLIYFLVRLKIKRSFTCEDWMKHF